MKSPGAFKCEELGRPAQLVLDLGHNLETKVRPVVSWQKQAKLPLNIDGHC